MKSLFLAASLFTSFNTMAEQSLHAHEHGAIKVGMAIEKNTIEIEIDGPAESFLGFEYLPKTAKEKKLLSDNQDRWNKQLETLIRFDNSLKCLVTESSFKQVVDEVETKEAKKTKEGGIHSDIEAKAKLRCIRNVSGSEVIISLKKIFSHIKKLNVEILSGETKTVEITKPVQTIKI